jgi:hypothetical protein
MSLHTRIASKLQTKPSDNNHRKVQSKHTTGSILALTAGITLALASAATNALYGFHRYDDLPYQITWAAVSVAASAILALGPTALLKAIKVRSLAGGILGLMAIGLTGAYSFTAAIGASAGQRITSQVTQTDTDGTRARLQTAYQTAKEELQGLPASSGTTAELEAKIAVLKATPGSNGCEKIDGPVSKRVCPEAAGLEIEQAKAAHREELQAKMDRADDSLKKLGPPRVANTDAAAIRGYLGLAGITVSTAVLNQWLALLAVALVEFGGGLAFAVSTVLRDPVQADPTERVEDQVSNPAETPVVDTSENGPKTLDEDEQPDVSNPAPAKMVVPDTFGGRLIVLLKDRGGELYSGHRALGRALGCSAGHVGNVLRDLANAGHVTVQATKMGTVVRLAA